MARFEQLFTPLTIGGHTLPNRVMMGSMHLGLEEAPGGFERMAAFYAERARGGVALVVTGGISPNQAGRPGVVGAVLDDESQLAEHRLLTEAVHAAGSKILLQLLHFGRYAEHDDLVAPSPLRSPIKARVPREMSDADVRQTIADFGRATRLALAAGYDGIEVMGSEGYLLNEFLAPATNQRDDAWGGDAERRRAFPLAVVREVRSALGAGPILSVRVSAVDLIPGGSTGDETLAYAGELAGAGADLLVTGIGWHESRVPTIATSVPRAAFAEFTRALRGAAGIPVAAANRINTPEVAERLLAGGTADLVALARPLLADPAFVAKAQAGTPDAINTCIGCNQACLDHALSGRITSCLVNPRACHETQLVLGPTRSARKIAVVGAGPAGLAAATAAGERGQRVTLFEARNEIGGQFDLARRIPGKEEFSETLRYFTGELERRGVEVRTGTRATADALAAEGFDEVIIASGVMPRRPAIPGADSSIVADYAEVLRGERSVGERVAILGSGGIGFDVAEFLTQDGPANALSPERFAESWGVTQDPAVPGGVLRPRPEISRRRVTMLQRKATKPGGGLGLTTGWIHRAEVLRRGVEHVVGASYDEITERGIRITVDGVTRELEVDTVVLCTGQESVEELSAALAALGIPAQVVGGALLAGELDAKRAIKQGTEAAAAL
ncbi:MULTISPECIES: NADPH-dependent 2,4-dienoyl-CoA reductase [unclassified Leucobacter]|uniref:NADPH-dependent 2,4-dienoyl-CoA reductase n=1 Tax=unclassified Leucobacter TaxID=2621730 RepID=UPI00165E91F9|nr:MULTISPECIES: NADPH-dependent 2,4-dienoyl-CoA reductase [unclassified Leucobacter]MBC9936151.1 NADPH-dependent 2,4-dienoyl-CoA reductase [Leucobacter sp. cx-87]